MKWWIIKRNGRDIGCVQAVCKEDAVGKFVGEGLTAHKVAA